jgi:hypothetical protein
MGRLKMLVVAALAAVTVGVGALAAAPSASALLPSRRAVCAEIFRKYTEYHERAEEVGPDAWIFYAYLNHQADVQLQLFSAIC